MKNLLLVGCLSVLTLVGCRNEPVSLFDRQASLDAAAAKAPNPQYFLRPSEMEEAAEVCPEGEVEAVGVTTEPVVVYHIICQNGVMFRKDKATGRVFKRVVS